MNHPCQSGCPLESEGYCAGRTNPRLCQLVADGVDGYEAHVRKLNDAGPPPPVEVPKPVGPRLPGIDRARRDFLRTCEHLTVLQGCRWGQCGIGRGRVGDDAVSVQECHGCPAFRPRHARPLPEGIGGADGRIAPLRDADAVALTIPRPWEGRIDRKPWQYPLTAAIVNLDTPDLLAAVVETLRAQTLRPFILVYDAGSIGDQRVELERWAAEQDDVELCLHRPTSWRWTSEPVATAMDWAFARCQTPLLYATHTDVFLKRPDYLEYLSGLCDEKTPVVGYQMSDRSFVKGCPPGAWEVIASHTASAYHMPTMRRLGAGWSMQRAVEILGIDPTINQSAWPDTETCLGLVLGKAGVGTRWIGDAAPGPDDEPSQLFLGPEPNEPYETEWLIHERSFTGQALYSAASKAARRDRVKAQAAAAIERARSWANPPAA